MSGEAPSKPNDIKELSTEVVGFDLSKLWGTVKSLTLDPGTSIYEYAQGDRSRLVSPITYFLLIFGLSFFLDSATGIGDYVMESFHQAGKTAGQDWAKGLKLAEKDNGTALPKSVFENATKIDSDLQDLIKRKEFQLIVLLPGLLLFQWLFFRKKVKSFFHNGYFALYTLAQYTLLFLPVSILFFISKPLFYYTYLVLGFVFPVLYNVYAGVNFYQTRWQSLVTKNILLLLCVTLAAMVTASLITSLWVIGLQIYYLIAK